MPQFRRVKDPPRHRNGSFTGNKFMRVKSCVVVLGNQFPDLRTQLFGTISHMPKISGTNQWFCAVPRPARTAETMPIHAGLLRHSNIGGESHWSLRYEYRVQVWNP